MSLTEPVPMSTDAKVLRQLCNVADRLFFERNNKRMEAERLDKDHSEVMWSIAALARKLDIKGDLETWLKAQELEAVQ